MNSTSRTASRSSIVVSSVTASGMVASFVGSRPWRRDSGLQIAVHEVDLLQATKALADVLRAYLPPSLDPLQLRVVGREKLLEAAELPHDLAHDQLRQARD